MGQTGKTMNKCCWYKPQVMLLVFPPPFSNTSFMAFLPSFAGSGGCSHQTLGSTLCSWVEWVIWKTFRRSAHFSRLKFCGFFVFFLTFTVIILWCVGVLSSLSRFWKQTHGGDVLQLDHLETSLFPIFLLKNHHFSYGFLKEWLVNSPGPGNLMDISRPKSKS